MTKTEDKYDVPVPEWAQAYEVGDQIAFEHPITGEVVRKSILGFSTVQKNIGCPVVGHIPGAIAPEVAVVEDYHLNGER